MEAREEEDVQVSKTLRQTFKADLQEMRVSWSAVDV